MSGTVTSEKIRRLAACVKSAGLVSPDTVSGPFLKNCAFLSAWTELRRVGERVEIDGDVRRRRACMNNSQAATAATTTAMKTR